jgi:DNA-binding transcriptional LysR family regulator
MNGVHVQIDLNLLRVLDVLLEERSATRTGARLGLSQSAVSHALGRLRHMVGDDLFVRGPEGMRPTPRALELGPQVHAALGQLHAALAPAAFDPETSVRRFTVAAGAYACAVLAPTLVARMSQLAPGVELAIAEYADDMVDRMDAREVDFLVGGVLAAPERFAREALLEESLAWVVAAGSPLGRRNDIDLEALASVPHVVIGRRLHGGSSASSDRGMVSRASWEDAGALEAALAAAGLKRRIGVTVPDTYSALAIATRSEMATLIPRRLARLSAQSGKVRLIEPPYASPPVEIGLTFLKDRLSEPALNWMRDLIHEVAAEV